MKIFRNGADSTSGVNPGQAVPPDGLSAATSPEPNAPTDEVRLSHMLGSLMSALRDPSAAMAAQTDGIGKLRSAVASGRYQVDPWLVSGSIIEHSIRFGATGDWGLST